MNDKEKELWRVIDNVIKCCAITNPDGTLSITREDVLKELNPQYAKDKARDEEIANIKSEVAGMKTNIDKILAAVTNK